MGKIDEDYSRTTIPNYDSPKLCKNCKKIIDEKNDNREKYCDICQKKFCYYCIDNHICGEKEQEEAEYNSIHEGEND